MKLDEGDHIIGVATCSEHDDVLLTTAAGQCIRFPVTDVRVFKGRDSTGVRGINLARGDTTISMAILRHVEATPEERATFLKRSAAIRRSAADEATNDPAESVADEQEEDVLPEVDLGEKYEQMDADQQFVLTVSERGFGKRTSSYEYRITGRGGKGIVAMATTERNGRLIASFPVEHEDQIMLVTDGGQLIRVPVDGIRVVGRATQGVTIFNTGESDKVVSVEHLEGEGEEEGEGGPDEAAEA